MSGSGTQSSGESRPFWDEHRLPTEDGGGIVFPNGFFGPGYYLPEWEFIRYCARADHQEQQRKPKSWWRKHMMEFSFTGLVLWNIAFKIVDWFTERYVGPGILGAATSVYILFLFYRGVFRIFHADRTTLGESYPTLFRLPVFSHWWPHVHVAMIKMKAMDWFWQTMCIPLAALCAFAVYNMVLKGALHFLIGLLLAPLFLVYSIHPLIILLSMLWIYARLRRRPSVADLRPVEPPATQAV